MGANNINSKSLSDEAKRHTTQKSLFRGKNKNKKAKIQSNNIIWCEQRPRTKGDAKIVYTQERKGDRMEATGGNENIEDKRQKWHDTYAFKIKQKKHINGCAWYTTWHDKN